MRNLTLMYNQTVGRNILFDGPKDRKDDRYRVIESATLSEIIDVIPNRLKRFNSEKPVEVYFEGYTEEQCNALEKTFSVKLPHARFIRANVVRAVNIVHFPNSKKHRLYDGPITNGTNHEYETLDELLDSLPRSLDFLDNTKTICVGIYEYSQDDAMRIQLKLSSALKGVRLHYEEVSD
ncbi:MAG: hypothetical protein WC533_02915 [Candidatus Pacearchaeota archaeon]